MTIQEGIVYFEKFFGRPFPYSKYDNVFMPEFSSTAMENVGCVIWDEEELSQGQTVTMEHRMDVADTNLHELSHQWFGNLVTMRWWDDLWLNESLATAMAKLALM